MFNNPFDSFHKTVGKAKKERERLDRLLTISTPGELALVGVTAVVLLLFAAWLLFGNVARSVTVEGVLVESGEQYPGESPSLHAVVWLERGLGRQIEPGMPVSLEAGVADGQARSHEGLVSGLSAVGPGGVAVLFESVAPVTMHRLDVALGRGQEFPANDGSACRIVIELGSQSPLAFFLRRQS
ncbi:MAG: hypothetical protein OXI11_03315 [Gammaproteobacteria bacterium]|nr:hypothetical protein [Gammaproteobacteria bacterium]MXW45954.1 hypothetical protein [Gammaproteobacteria bacterium]MYD02483.1 hypothetical protein [Gammaproteobacteria bacterium]MYI25969.1 hypothetical protein [Gammaproteobacteria bacterium]